MPEDEQPIASRFDTRTPAGCRVRMSGPHGNGPQELVTADVSERGAFLVGQPLPVGTALRIEIELPSGNAVVAAQVKWVRAIAVNPSMPAGMGVEFDEPQPDIVRAVLLVGEGDDHE